MSLHIEELICNVTVNLGSQPLTLEQAPPVAAEAGAATVPPQSEEALPRTITRPEAEVIMQSTVARQTRALAAEGALPADVDPEKVAERVYRLLREELQLACERE